MRAGLLLCGPNCTGSRRRLVPPGRALVAEAAHNSTPTTDAADDAVDELPSVFPDGRVYISASGAGGRHHHTRFSGVLTGESVIEPTVHGRRRTLTDTTPALTKAPPGDN